MVTRRHSGGVCVCILCVVCVKLNEVAPISPTEGGSPAFPPWPAPNSQLQNFFLIIDTIRRRALTRSPKPAEASLRLEFRMQQRRRAATALEWHYKAGQNSKQEKSQWQLLARTASDAANYANELISAVERTDKTKWPLLNHSWGLLKWWSQICNACSSIHSVHVCAVRVQSKHHLALTPMGYPTWIYRASEGWCFRRRSKEIYSALFS